MVSMLMVLWSLRPTLVMPGLSGASQPRPGAASRQNVRFAYRPPLQGNAMTAPRPAATASIRTGLACSLGGVHNLPVRKRDLPRRPTRSSCGGHVCLRDRRRSSRPRRHGGEGRPSPQKKRKRGGASRQKARRGAPARACRNTTGDGLPATRARRPSAYSSPATTAPASSVMPLGVIHHGLRCIATKLCAAVELAERDVHVRGTRGSSPASR